MFTMIANYQLEIERKRQTDRKRDREWERDRDTERDRQHGDRDRQRDKDGQRDRQRSTSSRDFYTEANRLQREPIQQKTTATTERQRAEREVAKIYGLVWSYLPVTDLSRFGNSNEWDIFAVLYITWLLDRYRYSLQFCMEPKVNHAGLADKPMLCPLLLCVMIDKSQSL